MFSARICFIRSSQKTKTHPHTHKADKTRTGLVSKLVGKTTSLPRPGHNNRKGSRHRLTPQAKGILEGWLAKHWLNPYPTEEEKMYLAQACLISVTQVKAQLLLF